MLDVADGVADDSQDPRPGPLMAAGAAPGPPKMKLATSLARAARDEFVYVGKQGEVRAPWQYRVQRIAGLGVAITASIGGTVLGIALGAPWLSLIYLGTLGWIANVWRLSERLKKGASLLAADRLEEAEAELLRLVDARGASRTLRALAWQNLAGVAARRGDHAEALQRIRKCGALFDRMWWPPAGPWKWINRFTEILLLAQLGRLDEARTKRRALSGAPGGEYFRILAMNADLMIAFAAQDPTGLPDDLHEWSKVALQTTTAELALTLLAWAHFTRGDQDMGEHLLGEATDRIDSDLFGRTYPTVWAWVKKAASQKSGAHP